MDPTKKLVSFAEEFRNFALKGSVIDLAVGVVIGAAFGQIVTSLVKNIIMPLVSLIMPADKGYTEWVANIYSPVSGTVKPIPVGLFLGDVVNFLIVALALFLFIVKFLGWIMRTKKEAPPPALTKNQELLAEIRDLLKNQRA
jgi:large conductance mechanosensitive channel